jgi:anti-sigma factor RsiW
MNCREAEHQIFAERDGALDPQKRAALSDHVSHCPACRRINDVLAAAIGIWKSQAAAVRAPEAERAWHDLRRRIRSEAAPATNRWPSWRAWVGAPLAAAAAVAAAIAINPEWRELIVTPGAVHSIAQAEYVEVPSATASTFVFVDDKSGWLVVLASDAPRRF